MSTYFVIVREFVGTDACFDVDSREFEAGADLDAVVEAVTLTVEHAGAEEDTHYADVFLFEGDGVQYVATVDLFEGGHRHLWNDHGRCSTGCGCCVDDFPSLVGGSIDWRQAS
jgi:hypothetical protein